MLNGDDDKLCEKKMVNGKPVVFYGIGKEAKLAKTEQGEKYLAFKIPSLVSRFSRWHNPIFVITQISGYAISARRCISPNSEIPIWKTC